MGDLVIHPKFDRGKKRSRFVVIYVIDGDLKFKVMIPMGRPLKDVLDETPRGEIGVVLEDAIRDFYAQDSDG
jgi:hypothetical protein